MATEVCGVTKILKAAAQGPPRLAAADNRHETMRMTSAKTQREQNAILLPNLLPNAVGQRGKETDAERSDTEEVPINRAFPVGAGM